VSRTLFRRDANSLLSGGLLALLLLGYVVLLYASALMIRILATGEPSEDGLGGPWWLYGISLALVAITIRPVTRWLRDSVNDLVYAQHDDPYVLTAKVNAQLQAMTDPRVTLPAVAETIAREWRLPYVAIETDKAEAARYAFGALPATPARRLPITYLGQRIGVLSVAPRSAGQPLSESDLALLRDVAQQLGVALRAAQLTADLQVAREALIIAREEERRRIRNDLHDELAPTLSSLQLQLGALRSLIHRDPHQAETLAVELGEDLRQSTATIRRLVYDLRPPLLDELGLVGAIKHLSLADADVSLEVIAPEPLPPLSAAVEVAAYRIASEALHNVAKHAEATVCCIELDVGNGYLVLTVTDNGCGVGSEARAGVGLRSMTERAAELGGAVSIQSGADGGTCVVARLPIGE